MAEDLSIRDHINALVAEERKLRDDLQAGEISVSEEHKRLREIEVELDRCWDLLRQRHAKREFGENPDDAQLRSAATVEDYLS